MMDVRKLAADLIAEAEESTIKVTEDRPITSASNSGGWSYQESAKFRFVTITCIIPDSDLTNSESTTAGAIRQARGDAE